MNSSFQINIYHGTFLENLSYWVLLSICQNLIKHWEILQKSSISEKILNLWSYRDLTYIGKVTVIETLALLILVQCLTVLPKPPDSVLNDIEEIFYKLLWNGKKTRSRDLLLSMNMKKGD